MCSDHAEGMSMIWNVLILACGFAVGAMYGERIHRWIFADVVMRRRRAIRDYKRGETPRSKQGIAWALLLFGRIPTNAEIERALYKNHLDVRTRRAV